MASPRRPNDGRPDPEALLARSQREGRARLKVFLGAAPGVGKTYSMLQNARRVKADGVDVAIGIVETHGRIETGALVEGLEMLPRRTSSYRERIIEEFDLDAALARKPKLLVVDELAHTNAPDSRHPKRWQDVEELLDAGIDVWTALNIQHLESLADVVSRITGIVVRETVPDKVLQEADAVVLVDITPDELIARLHEGKVYLPEVARRATERFFTPGNLTALRELALRRTADRVDDQMVDYLRLKAIEGPWNSSERLLACIAPNAAAERIVRRASQLATSLNAGWIAVHLERPGEIADAQKAEHVRSAMGLAERLGGETRRVSGADLVEETLRLARRENVTQIIVGARERSFMQHAFGRSFAEELTRRAGQFEIHFVHTQPAPAAPRPPLRRVFGMATGKRMAVETGVAALAVAGAVGVCEGLSEVLRLPNLSMVFLVAVLFCAVRFGVRAAVIASFLSFLAYNFFFIQPVYTFTIAEPHELLALLVFLAVAVLTGSLAGRIHDQREGVIRNAAVTQSLYDFSRKISGAATADDVMWAATAHLHATLGRQVTLLASAGEELTLQAAWPPDVQLDAAEASAARWAQQKGEPAGWSTGTLPRVRFQFRPLQTARGTVAVCGFEPPDAAAALSEDDERALSAVFGQTAIALDRALLAREAARATSFEENEKVRDALLASLSHDLRTPLAAIAGAASSLRDLGANMSEAERIELLASIEEETGRLSRFVANLLDMSRIEAGGLKARRDWVDVADVVRSAVARCRKAFPNARLRVSLAADLPFARGDARLLEQVLFNLLDNAQKYGGDGESAIHARREGEDLILSVTDEGPGVKPADLDRIFEKFYRGGRSDGRKAGTGLGLSICRGLVEAMGGVIIAQSPAARRRGTRIVVRLPAVEPPPLPGAET
ncbi:MAG: sensor histidine kinase KdpD [Hyphomicrobiales bacterium]|nr:sensor histidine kinase KdpD [Hyphomicrobiales bacterium]